jgi:hypothetical protein
MQRRKFISLAGKPQDVSGKHHLRALLKRIRIDDSHRTEPGETRIRHNRPYLRSCFCHPCQTGPAVARDFHHVLTS